MHAFDAQTGIVVWQGQSAQSLAATIAGDGIVFTVHEDLSSAASSIHMYNPMTGVETDLSLPVSSAAPLTVAGHMLFQPTGNPLDGTGGGIIAYTVP